MIAGDKTSYCPNGWTYFAPLHHFIKRNRIEILLPRRLPYSLSANFRIIGFPKALAGLDPMSEVLSEEGGPMGHGFRALTKKFHHRACSRCIVGWWRGDRGGVVICSVVRAVGLRREIHPPQEVLEARAEAIPRPAPLTAAQVELKKFSPLLGRRRLLNWTRKCLAECYDEHAGSQQNVKKWVFFDLTAKVLYTGIYTPDRYFREPSNGQGI